MAATIYSKEIKARFVKALAVVAKKIHSKDIQVAVDLGIRPENAYVIRDLQSNRSPTLDNCAALCDKHNISPSWLLLGKGQIFDAIKPQGALSLLQQAVLEVEGALQKIEAAENLTVKKKSTVSKNVSKDSKKDKKSTLQQKK